MTYRGRPVYPGLGTMDDIVERLDAALPQTPVSRTAEEALARALHQHSVKYGDRRNAACADVPLDSCYYDRTHRAEAARILAALSEAGYRIEAAGLRKLDPDQDFDAVGDDFLGLRWKAPDPATVEEIAQGIKDIGTGGTPAYIRGYNRGYEDAFEHFRTDSEAADWRNAAIEAGGTGEIRPGGGVAE